MRTSLFSSEFIQHKRFKDETGCNSLILLFQVSLVQLLFVFLFFCFLGFFFRLRISLRKKFLKSFENFRGSRKLSNVFIHLFFCLISKFFSDQPPDELSVESQILKPLKTSDKPRYRSRRGEQLKPEVETEIKK